MKLPFLYTISFLGGFCLSTASSLASSDEVMQDMLKFIENNSDYVYSGERLPLIEIRTREVLCESVYTEVPENCSVEGYYNHTTNTIYIADEPGKYSVEEGFFEVVLLHELVHFMQKINGEYETVRCKNHLEKDAYKLQALYVDYKGYPEEQKTDPLFAVFASMCPGDYY